MAEMVMKEGREQLRKSTITSCRPFACQKSYTFASILLSMYPFILPVDCSTHPLRIGYYVSPECTSLHTLTDSDGLPNAQYARLNHPASYHTGFGPKYYEYVAGSYLTIKLLKQAKIYGIAVQGSPDNLRYFLRSFELSYKVTVNNLDVNRAAVTTTNYYKENGIIKVCCRLTLLVPIFSLHSTSTVRSL